LRDKGIEILYALKENIYWVRVKGLTDDNFLKYLFDINPEYKKARSLSSRTDTHKLRLSIAPGMSLTEIEKWAEENNFSLLDLRAMKFGFIDVDSGGQNIEKIISTPWI